MLLSDTQIMFIVVCVLASLVFLLIYYLRKHTRSALQKQLDDLYNDIVEYRRAGAQQCRLSAYTVAIDYFELALKALEDSKKLAKRVHGPGHTGGRGFMETALHADIDQAREDAYIQASERAMRPGP